VPEDLRDDLGWDAVEQRQRRKGVAKPVQGEVGESGLANETLEIAADRRRVERLTARSREDQILLASVALTEPAEPGAP
jgi:hypothetical protein